MKLTNLTVACWLCPGPLAVLQTHSFLRAHQKQFAIAGVSHFVINPKHISCSRGSRWDSRIRTGSTGWGKTEMELNS